MKKYLPYIILLFLLHVSLFTKAQVTFNYDKITICDGDSYDLLKYQTNEVIVPVGWEIVGWKDITNTTVTPTVSPTIYTLQYREKANPSVILTQDLTITLRPKPTVSITPNGSQNICEGAPIHIEKVSATNYDNLYWILVQTGDKYTTDNIDATATPAYTERKMTYKLIATNAQCTTLAQDQVEYSVIDPNEDPQLSYYLKTYGQSSYYDIYYCSPLSVKDNIQPSGVCGPLGTTSSWCLDLIGGSSENSLMKLNRYDLIWDTEDEYTRGETLLSGKNWSRSLTLEAEIYFKTCGKTRIFKKRATVNYHYQCEGVFNVWTDCTYPYIRFYGGGVDGTITSLKSVSLKNLTLPGQYETAISTDYYNNAYDYYIKFDYNVPATMNYDVTFTYVALDGTTKTYTAKNVTVTFCKEKLIRYEYQTKDWRNSFYDFFSGFGALEPGSRLPQQGYNMDGKTSPTDTIEKSICLGEEAYTIFSSNLSEDMDFVWDNNPNPVAYNVSGSVNTNYTKTTTADGKTSFKIAPILQDGYAPRYGSIFGFSPTKTTVYTGTLYGLKFAIKVNVVDNHIAVTDTSICSGNSIDLKTLEKTDNINGSVLWNVSNTVVSPLVDTKYLIYGVAKGKCSSQKDYSITDTVLVHVDSPIWSTTDTIKTCLNDTLDLRGGINTNSRYFQWYDKLGNALPNGIVKMAGDDFYTVELKNGCGTKKDTVYVKLTGVCKQYKFARNDSLSFLCEFSKSVNVLTNDSLICQTPVVRIVKKPSLNGIVNASISGSTIEVSITQSEYVANLGKRDSIQYEVACGSKKDSAWVYVKINDIGYHGFTVTETADKLRVDVQIDTKAADTEGNSFYYSIYSYQTGGTSTVSSKQPYYTFDISSYTTGTYRLMVSFGGCFDMVNTFFQVMPPATKMEAKTDTLVIGCNGTGTINILTNDSSVCKLPSVRILKQPSISDITLSPWDGLNLKATIPDKTLGLYQGQMDSIQYEISCGGEKDTTWVYLKINTIPQIKTLTATPSDVSIELKGTASSSICFYILSNEDGSFTKTARTSQKPYSFTGLSLADGKYYLDVIDLSTHCSVTDSFLLKNGVMIPIVYIKANNDTIYRKTCKDIAGGMIFNVLANDHIACNSDSLSLRMLSSTYAPSTSFVMNNRDIYITYTYSGAAGPRKDSIQYEISCGMEKDTAFLYFIVQNPYPKITAVAASADSIHIETDIPDTVSSNIEFIYYSADFTIVASQTAVSSSYTFKNLNLPNGRYYVSVCQSFCCVLDSFMVNGTGASSVIAVNDTDSIKTCSASLEVKIPILSNDTFFCTTPSITLLTTPTLTGSTASLVQDSLHYTFSPISIATTDSLQYKLDCNGKTDTAWVYIHLLKKYYERAIKDSICQGKSYVFNGKSLSTAGTYKDTISNIIGCDSIITLELKYKQIDTIRYSAQPFGICEGDYTLFYGDTLRTAGIYYHTQSCDTIIRFDLFVKTRIKIAIADSVCQGSSYVFRGKTFTQAGTYTDTIPNIIADLCDTIVTLTLNYKQNIEKKITKQICKGDIFNFEGTTLSKSGKYTHLFPASENRCDSLLTLQLIVLEPDTSYLNINIKQGNSYSFGGQKIKTAGIYYNNLSNKFNCDSIVVLNLSVTDNESDFPISIPEVFTPNGDGVNDYFEIRNIDKYPKNHVLIINRWGNKLFEAGPYLNNWDGRAHFGVIAGDGLLPVGTYFYILDLGDGSRVKKGFIYLNR